MDTKITKLDNNHIGFAVRAARKAVDMAAKDLAQRVGITPVALSKIETGHQTLEFMTSVRIAATLGITLDQLAQIAVTLSRHADESAEAKRFLSENKDREEHRARAYAMEIIGKTAQKL